MLPDHNVHICVRSATACRRRFPQPSYTAYRLSEYQRTAYRIRRSKKGLKSLNGQTFGLLPDSVGVCANSYASHLYPCILATNRLDRRSTQPLGI